MRKKKGVIITVTTALVIAACGVGCLNAGMEKTMQEEVVTQVESNPDVILEEGSPEESSPEEIENLVYQANQVWQEEESIYLPEGAEIVVQGKDSYGIVWDNYSIEYWQNDKYFAKETQEDLGLGKVVLILKDTIQKYSGQDMGNCEIEVVLADPEDDYEGGEDCEPITLETTDGEVLELKTTDGEVHMIIADVEGAANVREYENDAKCYQVGVSFDKHDYFICVDSVTGEVLQYYYQNSNFHIPNLPIKNKREPVHAHNLTILPVFCGISGSYSTMFSFVFMFIIFLLFFIFVIIIYLFFCL